MIVKFLKEFTSYTGLRSIFPKRRFWYIPVVHAKKETKKSRRAEGLTYLYSDN